MLQDILKPDDHFTFDELRQILTTENLLIPGHEKDAPLREGTIRAWMSKLGIKLEPENELGCGYYSLLSLTVLVCWIRSRDNLKSIKFIPALLREKPNVREDIERELRAKYGKQSNYTIDAKATDTQD